MCLVKKSAKSNASNELIDIMGLFKEILVSIICVCRLEQILQFSTHVSSLVNRQQCHYLHFTH